MRRLVPLLVGLALLPACGNISGGDQGGGADFTVAVDDNKYTPASLTVPLNATVTWTWIGTNNHSVTFDAPGGPDSDIHAPPFHYNRTFTTRGTYTYHCRVHGAGMSGSVIVS